MFQPNSPLLRPGPVGAYGRIVGLPPVGRATPTALPSHAGLTGAPSSGSGQHHALKNAGLDVRLDTNPALRHHKAIIVDDATLILGSFNFSASAQHSNDENMRVIRNDPQLVAAYEAEYARMQALSA